MERTPDGPKLQHVPFSTAQVAILGRRVCVPSTVDFRANGRWVAGVTDQHGMGATVQSWTLIPRGSVGDPCADALDALRTRGFAATQVIDRHRLRVDSPWPKLATAPRIMPSAPDIRCRDVRMVS